MTLRGEVVDLVRLDLPDEACQLRAIRQIAVVKEELHPFFMRIAVEVVDPMRVEGGGPSDDAVDLVSVRPAGARRGRSRPVR